MKISTNNQVCRTHAPSGRIARLLVVLAFAALFSAACDVHTSTAPGALFSITVSPNPTLSINATQQFVAVGSDDDGDVVVITPTWSIAAGGGAISGAGLFTAGTVPGTYTATVHAVSNGVTGTATVTVTVGPLAAIVVSPNPRTLPVNGTQQVTAVGWDAAGNVIAITPVWSVVASGGSIATGGLFTAGAVTGTFSNTVRATSGGISGFATVVVTSGVGILATIEVSPNPSSLATNGTQQFAVVGRDAAGAEVAVSPVWSVVASGGSIGSGGFFTAGAVAGTFSSTVRATSGGISGFATVTVTSTIGPLATIIVAPNPRTLLVNGTQQFTAEGRDASGNVITISPVWSVVASGGSIATGGLFTAGTVAGTFSSTVRATSGGISGSATVVVTSSVGALATIAVSPSPSSLGTNGTQQFTAVGKDAAGADIAISPVWSVVAGGGSIGTGGLFTAGTVTGTFPSTVRATSGSISGSATVTVTTIIGPLATITVAPNPWTMLANGTRQYSAVGRDASGNVISISPVWSVVASGGLINSAGLFTAGAVAGTFTNTIRATSGATSGFATVTVTSTVGVLATIEVSPNPSSLVINGTQLFTAVGKDITGTVISISPVWSVVASGGSIGTGGLFTAGAVTGTFSNTVKATSGSISGTATVFVTPVGTPAPTVPLGAAGTHGILAGSTITCVNLGVINADASVWPGSAITGFGPCVITGAQHAADPFAQTAQAALTVAYNQLDNMPCGATLTANLGGQTLQPGVYCSTSSQGLTGEMFLNALGDANAIFVIKAASTLTTATAQVTLLNGAQAKNIYWLVGSSATLGVGSAMKGNIIAFTSITLVDNATLLGRALARNGAVTMGTNNSIILP